MSSAGLCAASARGPCEERAGGLSAAHNEVGLEIGEPVEQLEVLVPFGQLGADDLVVDDSAAITLTSDHERPGKCPSRVTTASPALCAALDHQPRSLRELHASAAHNPGLLIRVGDLADPREPVHALCVRYVDGPEFPGLPV